MAPESTPGSREHPISRFSVRRKSVQVILAMMLILVVSVVLLVQAIAISHRTLVVLASLCLGLVVFAFSRLVYTGIRTVELEIWIRHMGEGNLDYTVTLAGNDEVNEAEARLPKPWRGSGSDQSTLCRPRPLPQAGRQTIVPTSWARR